MNLQLTTYNLKLALIFMLICGLLTLGSGLLYGQDDYLNVKGNTRANTITFAGNLTDYPAAPLEGEIFYNSQAKLPRYFDGTTWKNFGGGPKTVATRIVAASDTPNGASRADYVCDGTDDQVNINRAINSLPANGGAVYLLEGTYNISTALEDGDLPASGETVAGIIPHSNTAIIGTGRGTVLKIVSLSNSLNVIYASDVNGILISQLMIDGGNLTGASSCGIYFRSVTYSKIDKVWVENTNREGIILSQSSNNNTISNSNIQGVGPTAGRTIYLSNSCNNNIISNNNIKDNSGMGIAFFSSSNNIISDNNVQGNGTQCISLGTNSNYNIISNNNLQGNNFQGILVGSNSNNNIISHNNIRGNGAQGIYLSAGAGLSANNNTISHNNVQGNAWGGIRLYSSSTNTITGNIIYDNGGTGAYDGIIIEGDSDTNLISSNRISDTTGTGYGINISADTCENNYLVSNLIDGAGYTGRLIQDLSINPNGTRYTDKAKMTLERKQVNISGSSFSLNVTTSPQTYVALNPTVNTTLTFSPTAIPVAGSLLILENVSATYSVTINDTPDDNVNLSETHSPILGPYDTLKLIWNGTRWLETEYVDN